MQIKLINNYMKTHGWGASTCHCKDNTKHKEKHCTQVCMPTFPHQHPKCNPGWYPNKPTNYITLTLITARNQAVVKTAQAITFHAPICCALIRLTEAPPHDDFFSVRCFYAIGSIQYHLSLPLGQSVSTEDYQV